MITAVVVPIGNVRPNDSLENQVRKYWRLSDARAKEINVAGAAGTPVPVQGINEHGNIAIARELLHVSHRRGKAGGRRTFKLGKAIPSMIGQAAAVTRQQGVRYA